MSLLRRLGTLVILLVVLDTLPGYRGWAAPPRSDACAPHPWAGIYPTVMTPFTGCGGIDTHALECQLRHELAGGVHGLLVLGTYGEGQFVSMPERAQVVATAVRVAGGKVPV